MPSEQLVEEKVKEKWGNKQVKLQVRKKFNLQKDENCLLNQLHHQHQHQHLPIFLVIVVLSLKLSTCQKVKKYNKNKVETNLVTFTRVSTNEAAKICKQFSHNDINIPTSNQAAIYVF